MMQRLSPMAAIRFGLLSSVLLWFFLLVFIRS
ncbi:hypothetical protein FHS31_001443 [Sphingomonas vulcanisoli]|uniref:Uncharacterized protein n=1 Tax=Sphingomonas vulcanisoli TaxID=1658060 RepID=A0ABX0TRX5_9SPHN|nr:hypothetical protein [Sphingomonas vulcanisoli]